MSRSCYSIFCLTFGTYIEQEPHSKRRAPPPPFTDEGTCGRDEAMSPAGPRDEEPMESSKWVLQGPGEAPDVAMQQGGNTWLADVRCGNVTRSKDTEYFRCMFICYGKKNIYLLNKGKF